MIKTVIIQLDQYNAEELALAMGAAFEKLQLRYVFQENEQILIKPNMLSAVAPEKSVTPHPLVFAALADALETLKVQLSYGDSPAIDSPERAARICGFASIADEKKIVWADFSNSIETDIPNAFVFRKIPLAKGVAATDGLVTLAKMKTHALTSLTGVIKNQFGVIPGTVKAQLHVNFPDINQFGMMLADINKLIKPRLAVLDGIMAMEGNGPRNGSPKPANMLILSTDLVAVDSIAALTIGLDPAQLPFITYAAEAGLGEIDPDKMPTALLQVDQGAVASTEGVFSDFLDTLRVPDFKLAETEHSLMSRATRIGAPFAKQFLMNRPVIDEAICTKCGICVKACPVKPKALRQDNAQSVPVYQYRRCIRCYCCQEVCPVGAISVKKTFFGRFIRS